MNFSKSIVWSILFVLLLFGAAIMVMLGAIGGYQVEEYYRGLATGLGTTQADTLVNMAVFPIRMFYEVAKCILFGGLLITYLWGLDMINPGWITEIKEKIHKRTE
jgi:hypothetical protein